MIKHDNYQICLRCVSDTSIPGIRFDANGVCNFCEAHDRMEQQFPLNVQGPSKLDQLVQEIKDRGRNKEYDCVVGVSGGRDSTYTLYTAVQNGLRPLAVHFDNGWNSEIAVSNIKAATSKLNIDLHTVVADWDEFRDLQKSFLLASVPDAEIPTDYVIISVLYQAAAEVGTRYILSGHSFRTEGIAPKGWTYMDGRYLKSVHHRFGNRRLTSFPILSLSGLLYYTLVKRIRYISLLAYTHYTHKEAQKVLEKELGWVYYGGHHHENVYTHFFQSYLCPHKFHVDKRKIEYSALVRSRQMTREFALQELHENPHYPYDKEIVNYAITKLGLTKEEFNSIMSSSIKTFHDYPSYNPVIQASRIPIKVACTLHMLPPLVYEKYLG
ncbi:MAG: N-acetyl sugar amidotransferase [Chloroflexota bacterium]|nr:N-acetyl sugar amidotransferase [Chloroflexota bacterium]